MEKVTYRGWPNCYRLANDEVELIVTGNVGPRIIRFGFIGDDNELVRRASRPGWRARVADLRGAPALARP